MTTTTTTRRLGRSGLVASAIGAGCWAIGGPWDRLEGDRRLPAGWGQIDDAESIRAIHRALDLGVTFFDTANVYGTGHSERVLGQALAGRRHDVVIATKFGAVFDEATRTRFTDREADYSRAGIEAALDDSLRRLNTDYIDLYQLHTGDLDPARGAEMRDVLEDLVQTGKIRWYGWSTDHVDRARVFAQGAHCTAIQHRLNVSSDMPEMLALCDEFDLASLNKGPLGSGFLTGKYDTDATFAPDDIRHGLNLKEGPIAQRLAILPRLRALLTAGGRTMAQGALGWILARHPRAIPIPGFKTVAQIEDNAGTLERGPLSQEVFEEIEKLMGRHPSD